MLDTILGTKTNILILRLFTKFHSQSFSVEDIVKETCAGQRNIYKALGCLVSQRILIKNGRFYRFILNSSISQLIYSLFEEERRRFFLPMPFYKILAEIESKITLSLKQNLMDVFIFGSVAKGRASIDSDIDICVLVADKTPDVESKIREIGYAHDFPNEVHFHVFTGDEFLDAKSNGNPLILDIIRDGLSLKMGR